MTSPVSAYSRGTSIHDIQRAHPSLTLEQIREAIQRQGVTIDGRTDRIEADLPVRALQVRPQARPSPSAPRPATSNVGQQEIAQQRGRSRLQRLGDEINEQLARLSRRNAALSTPAGRFAFNVIDTPTRPAQRQWLNGNRDHVFVSVRYEVDPSVTPINVSGAQLTARGKIEVEVQVPVQLTSDDAIANLRTRVLEIIEHGMPFSADQARDDAQWPPGSMVMLRGSFTGGVAASAGDVSVNAQRQTTGTITYEKTASARMNLRLDLQRADTLGASVAVAPIGAGAAHVDERSRGREFNLDLNDPAHTAALDAALPWRGNARRWLQGFDLSHLAQLPTGGHRFGFASQNSGWVSATGTPGTGVTVTARHSRSGREQGSAYIPAASGQTVVTSNDAGATAARLMARDPQALERATPGTELELITSGDRAWNLIAGLTTSSSALLGGYLRAEASVTGSVGHSNGTVARVHVRYIDDGGETKAVVTLRRYDAQALTAGLKLEAGLTITDGLRAEVTRYRQDLGVDAALADMLRDHASGGSRIAEKIGDRAYERIRDELNHVLQKLAVRIELRNQHQQATDFTFTSAPIPLRDRVGMSALRALVRDYDPAPAVQAGLFTQIRTDRSNVRLREREFRALLLYIVSQERRWHDIKHLQVRLPSGDLLEIEATDAGASLNTETPFERNRFKVRLVNVFNRTRDSSFDTQVTLHHSSRDEHVWESEKRALEAAVRHLGLNVREYDPGDGSWVFDFISPVYGSGQGNVDLRISRDGLRNVVRTPPEVFEQLVRVVSADIRGTNGVPPGLTSGDSPLRTNFENHGMWLAWSFNTLQGARDRGEVTAAAFEAQKRELEAQFEQVAPGANLAYTAFLLASQRPWTYSMMPPPGDSDFWNAVSGASRRTAVLRDVRSFIDRDPQLRTLGVTHQHVENDLFRARAAEILREFDPNRQRGGEGDQGNDPIIAEYRNLTGGRSLEDDHKVYMDGVRARALVETAAMANARARLQQDPNAQFDHATIRALVDDAFTKLVAAGMPGTLNSDQDKYAMTQWLALCKAAGLENVIGQVRWNSNDNQFRIAAGVDGIQEIDIEALMREVQVVEVRR